MKKKCKCCQRPVRRGKSLEGLAAQLMSYCLFCYRERFPLREELEKEMEERPLGYTEMNEYERYQFDGREQDLWEPEFYEEWCNYVNGGEDEKD